MAAAPAKVTGTAEMRTAASEVSASAEMPTPTVPAATSSVLRQQRRCKDANRGQRHEHPYRSCEALGRRRRFHVFQYVAGVLTPLLILKPSKGICVPSS